MRKLYKMRNGKLVPATEGELYIGIEPIYGESIFRQYYTKYMEYRRDKYYAKELLGPQTTNNPTRNKP